jgi:hypothetical protein
MGFETVLKTPFWLAACPFLIVACLRFQNAQVAFSELHCARITIALSVGFLGFFATVLAENIS